MGLRNCGPAKKPVMMWNHTDMAGSISSGSRESLPFATAQYGLEAGCEKEFCPLPEKS